MMNPSRTQGTTTRAVKNPLTVQAQVRLFITWSTNQRSRNAPSPRLPKVVMTIKLCRPSIQVSPTTKGSNGNGLTHMARHRHPLAFHPLNNWKTYLTTYWRLTKCTHSSCFGDDIHPFIHFFGGGEEGILTNNLCVFAFQCPQTE